MIDQIRQDLFAMEDPEYREFQCKLIPTIAKEKVIGVRVPKLREYAKKLFLETDSSVFLDQLPHQYLEENCLHGFLIGEIHDIDVCIDALNRFLPYVDNWATCDMLRPKCFKKQREVLLDAIKEWLKSDKTYTIRFGIEMLMVHFLQEAFEPDYLEWVSEIDNNKYYVNMMIAWYFATALTFQYDAAVPYLVSNRLPTWVHNKTIQKAVDSYRISGEKKAYLRSLRRRPEK